MASLGENNHRRKQSKLLNIVGGLLSFVGTFGILNSCDLETNFKSSTKKVVWTPISIQDVEEGTTYDFKALVNSNVKGAKEIEYGYPFNSDGTLIPDYNTSLPDQTSLVKGVLKAKDDLGNLSETSVSLNVKDKRRNPRIKHKFRNFGVDMGETDDSTDGTDGTYHVYAVVGEDFDIASRLEGECDRGEEMDYEYDSFLDSRGKRKITLEDARTNNGHIYGRIKVKVRRGGWKEIPVEYHIRETNSPPRIYVSPSVSRGNLGERVGLSTSVIDADYDPMDLSITGQSSLPGYPDDVEVNIRNKYMSIYWKTNSERPGDLGNKTIQFKAVDVTTAEDAENGTYSISGP